MCSCGTYRYQAPTANTAIFSQENEYQIEGNLGSSGANVRFAAALPFKIGIVGMYNGEINGTSYHSKEFEFGLGYYKEARPVGFFAFGGLGFGNNYELSGSNSKLWEGRFYRPFAQFNYGSVIDFGDPGGFILETVGVFKVSNFIYEGMHFDSDQTKIESNYFLLEPAVSFGLGNRVFQFKLISGFPFRPATERLPQKTNARTFPANIALGLTFFVGRNKP